MKKLLLLLCLIPLIAGCVASPNAKNNNAEEEFNNSGRAKAYEHETDSWPAHKDEDANFHLRYSFEVSTDDSFPRLTIDSQKINTLKGTMGFNRETATKNQASLNNGEYGQDVDWPLEGSKKVRAVDGPSTTDPKESGNGVNKNAQEFMVLGRFEICDVTFERKLYFFNNGHQVIITLIGDKEKIIAEMPEYFTTNQENCMDEIIWDIEKQEQFYTDLASNKGSNSAQDWFDTFDRIVETITIDKATMISKLFGRWVSLDDEKSVIEFTDSTKIDTYNGEKMSEDIFKLNEKHLTVGAGDDLFEYDIIEITDETLTMIYLGRGNILRYQRLDNQAAQ